MLRDLGCQGILDDQAFRASRLSARAHKQPVICFNVKTIPIRRPIPARDKYLRRDICSPGQAAGIPVRVLDEALSAATRARAHVLERMAQCSPAPRNALGPYTPRILHVAVPLTKVGLVIGSGGKTARSILERSGCTSLEVCLGLPRHTTGMWNRCCGLCMRTPAVEHIMLITLIRLITLD